MLIEESDRFVNYIFSDVRLREKIVDKASFVDALLKVLNSDPSLANISIEINRKGESIEVCGQNIFDHHSIQSLIKSNISKKRKDISARVRQSKPSLTRSQRTQEVNRRLNIFIKTSSQKIRQTKQISIDDALRPVKVSGYTRGGQTIRSYKKGKYRQLTQQEQMLLENGIRKGKKPSEIIDDYVQAGLGYRSPTSIRRHYYRVKKKI